MALTCLKNGRMGEPIAPEVKARQPQLEARGIILRLSLQNGLQRRGGRRGLA